MSELKTQYYSVSEVAKILGCSDNHVYNLVKKGEIESIRFGKKYFIPVDFLERKIEKK